MAAGLPFRVRRTSQEDPSSLSPESHPVSGTGIPTPLLPRHLDLDLSGAQKRGRVERKGRDPKRRFIYWRAIPALMHGFSGWAFWKNTKRPTLSGFSAGSCVRGKFKIIVRHFIDLWQPSRLPPSLSDRLRRFATLITQSSFIAVASAARTPAIPTAGVYA